MKVELIKKTVLAGLGEGRLFRFVSRYNRQLMVFRGFKSAPATGIVAIYEGFKNKKRYCTSVYYEEVQALGWAY